jgi:hypothetical protein
MKKIKAICLTFLFAAALFPPGAGADALPPASPESQGISPEALEKLKETVAGYLDSEQIVGAELVVIKNRFNSTRFSAGRIGKTECGWKKTPFSTSAP